MNIQWSNFRDIEEVEILNAKKTKLFNFSRTIIVENTDKNLYGYLKTNILKLFLESIFNFFNSSYLFNENVSILSAADIDERISSIANEVILSSDDTKKDSTGIELNTSNNTPPLQITPLDQIPETFIIGECQEESSEMRAYNLEDTIYTLIELKKSGQKLGLVLGRDASQKLPKKEGVTFASLDREVPEELSVDRYHIRGDFRELNEIPEKLHGLFSEIILDKYTRRFCPDVVSFAWQLLEKSPDSVLIFEENYDSHGVVPTDGKIIHTTHGQTEMGILISEDPFKISLFPNDLKTLAEERELQYFAENFEETLVRDANNFYPSRVDPKEDHKNDNRYFILRGPKSEQLLPYPEISDALFSALDPNTQRFLKNNNYTLV